MNVGGEFIQDDSVPAETYRVQFLDASGGFSKDVSLLTGNAEFDGRMYSWISFLPSQGSVISRDDTLIRICAHVLP